MGPQEKEYEKPMKMEKAKKWILLPEPPERMKFYWHSDFSPVKLVSELWLPKLYNKFDLLLLLFLVTKCVVFSYSCNSRGKVALVVKKLPANIGDIRDKVSIPGSGRCHAGGHENPFQYTCLGNPRDRRSWWATVHGVTKSWTQLSNLAHTHIGRLTSLPLGEKKIFTQKLYYMPITFIGAFPCPYTSFLQPRVMKIIIPILNIAQSALGFPGCSEGKESSCNVGDLGSIPGLGRPPWKGNSYPLQCSGLENSMDRGAWQATVQGLQRHGHDRATFTFRML